MRTRAGKFLAFSFVLFFLFAQSASLLHTHGAEFKKHVDCELCRNVGFGDDAIATTHSIPEFSSSAQLIASLPTLAASFERLAAKSRSPPLFV